ncbi:MAG: NAD-dependent epimerase/dehydratase family protein [Rhodospirillales bacterium]|nr:NAD-dependent epimerase/dehydratase family protein [Rhodospirillales bacterium]
MTVLVTGAAGFIGFHTSLALLARGETVVGIDNVNDYYDVSLKRARLARLGEHGGFSCHEIDIADREAVFALFAAHPDIRGIVHLAAQAGVRYSLINPYAYTHSNVEGHLVLLEAARKLEGLKHFVYASSSSVYGTNTKLPFSIDDRVDTPISIYAATKKSMEMISHAYSHLYGLPLTGLRFFTVYGPWGRPDMAAFLFARKILAGEAIPVFNQGDMRRDFTYIDDIVAGVIGCLDHPPADGGPKARVYNIGNNRSERLMDYIAEIEKALGRKATIDFQPMQPGDVKETYADIAATTRDFGFVPRTPIGEGVPRFVDWYCDHYGVKR